MCGVCRPSSAEAPHLIFVLGLPLRLAQFNGSPPYYGWFLCNCSHFQLVAL